MQEWLDSLDRRFIYFLVILVVAVPLLLEYSVPPARMKSAELLYDTIEKLPNDEGKVAFIAIDFGPNTKAENEPQATVIVEHLFRRRIPVVLFTQYALAQSFLETIPEGIQKRLMEEFPGQTWEYGKDWINIGYRPGGALFVQGIPKSENLLEYFGKDANGTPLTLFPAFDSMKSIEDFSFLGEFTGLVGAFDLYVQFFQSEKYTPPFGHGCTSITIPEAYIYLDSGQLVGLLEGIAGAAWYSELLKKANPKREVDSAIIINTALGFAHLAIIFLIVLGNISHFRLFGRGE